jgi:[pyruvate, water dikinase]-phosphate phosphotransferase / [pyruvate, water dikinase] kinase
VPGRPEVCKALVRAGIGLSFLSLHGLRSEFRAGRLVRVPVTGLSLVRPIFLARHSGKRNPPVMESILQIVERGPPKTAAPGGEEGRGSGRGRPGAAPPPDGFGIGAGVRSVGRIPAKGSGTGSMKKAGKKGAPPPVYIVSGGSGASGQRIAETALAQFPALRVPVIIRNNVRSLKQVETAVKEAEAGGGTVVHTLVAGGLREALTRFGRECGVVTIDLMGPLLERVAEQTGVTPLEQPGLYRKLRKDYFDRVEAIDFAVSHDDGNRPEDIPFADIVIVGVSRCGKTPLSMYLAVHGWKTANIPIVRDIPLPGELFRMDRRRVIGLSIGHRRLLEYRKKREEHMGIVGTTAYSSPSAVLEEIEAAGRICREGGFHVVDVTDRPIEIIAAEIVKLITSGLNEKQRRPVPF